MNKIFIDKEEFELKVSSNSYYIEVKTNTNLNLEILENINASIDIFIKNSNISLNINQKNNSNLKINILGIDSSVDINLITSAKIEIIDSILVSNDSVNKIKINCLKNSDIKLYANGINLDNNKCYFLIDGIIKKEACGVKLLESSKIINIKNGDSKIVPNLIVDNQDIVANHAAFIGKFDVEVINYLLSRGILEKDINRLLTKAILLSNMNTSNKDKFSDEIFKKID